MHCRGDRRDAGSQTCWPASVCRHGLLLEPGGGFLDHGRLVHPAMAPQHAPVRARHSVVRRWNDRTNGETAALARLAATTNIETIRYYERVALLPAPARSSGGYRLYGNDHLKRLNFIRRARTLGFSIGEVRTLLRLADERKRPCAEIRVVAEAHLKDVRAKIADLRRMERVLKATVAGCAEGRRSDCPVIEALYRNGSVVG